MTMCQENTWFRTHGTHLSLYGATLVCNFLHGLVTKHFDNMSYACKKTICRPFIE